MELKGYIKTKCEKYELRFKNGDHVYITIDADGIFNCQGSFGPYGYHWFAFGKSFKEFLCELDTGYLLNKLCEEDYLDLDKYIEKCKINVIKLRKEFEIDKDQARGLWNFFENELCGSYEVVCERLYENGLICDLCDYDIYHSVFSPKKEYHPLDEKFFKEVFPCFVEILKNEEGWEE